MRKLLLYALLIFTLVSCEQYGGEIHFYWQFKVFLGLAIVVIFLIGVIKSAEKEQKRNNERFKEEGINPKEIVNVGTYAGGHPGIDNNIKPAVIYRKEKKFMIAYRETPFSYPMIKGEIPTERIKEIILDDATTLDNKITVGRILLVGIFALGWKKKKKNELAFVTIEWNDGRFKHSAIFSFEGKDAMQKANTARNRLLKII